MNKEFWLNTVNDTIKTYEEKTKFLTAFSQFVEEQYNSIKEKGTEWCVSKKEMFIQYFKECKVSAVSADDLEFDFKMCTLMKELYVLASQNGLERSNDYQSELLYNFFYTTLIDCVDEYCKDLKS